MKTCSCVEHLPCWEGKGVQHNLSSSSHAQDPNVEEGPWDVKWSNMNRKSENQPVDPAGQSLHELLWLIHSFPDENIERVSFWTMINHGVGQLCNITRNIWLSIIIYAQDFHLLPPYHHGNKIKTTFEWVTKDGQAEQAALVENQLVADLGSLLLCHRQNHYLRHYPHHHYQRQLYKKAKKKYWLRLDFASI